jgi:hypothetical protein
MQKQWQPPAYWQDFEEMCFRLFQAELKARNAYLHGRAGQEQFGVDIAISTPRSGWYGIQCKLKSELLGAKLSKRELIAEQKKARRFKPPLKRLLVATTCERDTRAQRFATEISGRTIKALPVAIKFWSDIESLLQEYPSIAQRFYPERFSHDVQPTFDDEGVLSISLGSRNWRDALALFFAHPAFTAATGNQSGALQIIAAELIDNALNLSKGGASRVLVELDGKKFSILDDGAIFDSFNSTIALSSDMQGIRAVRQYIAAAGTELSYSYKAKNSTQTRFNVVEIAVSPSSTRPGDPCSASMPTRYVMDRISAAEFVDNLSIPASCQSFEFSFHTNTFFAHSAGSEIVQRLIRRLGGRPLRLRVPTQAKQFGDMLKYFESTTPGVTVIQD